MARLPQPGSDDGTWGNILNDYLAQSHKTDGSLKDNIVTSSTLAPNAVNTNALAVTGGTDGQVLTKDSGSASGMAWGTVSGGVVPDASAGTKGIVQLTGDLGGTAANPTVPGLAGKEATITAGTTSQYYRGDKSWQTLDKSVVGLANVDNTSDANKPISSATQTALNAKAADSAVVHNTGAETVAGVKTFSSSPIVPTPTTGTQAANKTYVDNQIASGTAPDATTSSKGIVQLAGDLGGTATAPTVARVNGVSVTGTPSAGQVLKATSASAASWQADATGGGGSGSWNFRTVTSSLTLANGDYALADATSTGLTLTLPAPTNGGLVRVKRMSSNANGVQVVSPTGFFDETYAGSWALGNQYDSMEFVSDGTNWYRG